MASWECIHEILYGIVHKTFDKYWTYYCVVLIYEIQCTKYSCLLFHLALRWEIVKNPN